MKIVFIAVISFYILNKIMVSCSLSRDLIINAYKFCSAKGISF